MEVEALSIITKLVTLVNANNSDLSGPENTVLPCITDGHMVKRLFDQEERLFNVMIC